MSIGNGVTASILAGVLAFTLGTAALAAPTAVSRNPAKIAEAGQAQTTAVSDGEEDAAATCSKSRKRLWIEGEGWIVRKVTTCR